MKKFIINSLLFVTVFILLYYSAYCLFYNELVSNKYSSRPSITKLTLDNFFSNNNKYDVIFLGSSHAYRSFDPRIFNSKGVRSYNLGTTSQTPLNSYVLLERVISRTKAVFLEVYPITVSSTGKESYIDFLVNYNDYYLLTEMALGIFDTRSFQLLTLKPIIDYKNIGYKPKINNFYMGYIETDKVAPNDIKYESYILDDRKINNQLKYVNKIIDLCKKNEVNLFLIYAPVPSKLNISSEENFLSQIYGITKSRNIVFLNFGRNHNFDDNKYFFDDDHMNKDGVKKTNQLILNFLRNKGFI